MRLFTGILILTSAASCFAQVSYEDILKSPSDNWLTYAGDYRGLRHSSLKQITVDNAGSLTPKWVYHVPKASGLRTGPIVYDGVMYITATNEIRALDARTGRLIWQFKEGRSKKDARQSRRGDSRRPRLFRHRRCAPGRARPAYGRGVVGAQVRRYRSGHVRLGGSCGAARQDYRRRRRRRYGNARICYRALARGRATSCGARIRFRRAGRRGRKPGGITSSTAAARRGCPALTIPIRIRCSGRPGILGPIFSRASGAATTFIAARCWRSMRTRGR